MDRFDTLAARWPNACTAWAAGVATVEAMVAPLVASLALVEWLYDRRVQGTWRLCW